ncbi:MAG: transcriptional repressor [Bacteroidales bacterium]|jgi:Fur family ferric uptake transcriptional regulator/Fur family peroxide stress response transcriptional regulator|nr:transcriptional repressor [Bacteroidales bacterium]
MITKIKEIQERLQRADIRPSVQRMAVMEFLLENRIHPTIDMIYNGLSAKIPTLSKTTVYNTVKTLSDSGVIQTICIDDKNLRYDADIALHAHFKCNICDCVIDLPVSKVQVEMQNSENVHITETHLYYKGFCEKCRTNNK